MNDTPSARYATLCIGRVKYDRVAADIDGETRWLDKTHAREHYLTLEQAVAFPHGFEQWWQRRKLTTRTWFAEFLTAAAHESVPLAENPRDVWGFPVEEAIRLLDQLAADGWRLVHVSEDHGLYAGADAASEAYLARVRYLMSRD